MNHNITRNSIIVFLLTGFSQALGFLREILFAYFQGTGSTIEAFQVAETIPLLFTQILLNAVPMCFIPLLILSRDKDPEKEQKTLSTAFTFFLAVTVVAMLLLLVFPTGIIGLVSPGFNLQTQQTAARFVTILAPNVVFLSLSSIFSASLNSRQNFTLPAAASLSLNIFTILALLFFKGNMSIVAAASSLAGITMFFIVFLGHKHIVGAIRLFAFDRNAFREIIRSLAFIMMVSAMVSINLIIDKAIATLVGAGSVASLTYAYKIINLPVYLVSMSVIRVLLPELSRYIANGEHDRMNRLYRRVIWVIVFAGLLVGVSIFFLREFIVSVIFGRGAFSLGDVYNTASCLSIYAFGITWMALHAFLQSVGYAAMEYKASVFIGAVQLVVSAVTSLVSIRFIGAGGVALGGVMAYSMAAILWALLLQSRHKLFIYKKGTRRMPFFSRVVNTVKRYAAKDSSSLAFWWLPVGEGTGYLGLSQEQTADYYLDFSKKADYQVLFDTNGVILLDYKGDLNVQYNPCAVAQYGLGLFSMFLKTGEERYLHKAESQARWLCESIMIGQNGIGRWEYILKGDAAYALDMLPGNWISSITQGQGVSFLLRLYLHTGNENYLTTAKSAFLSFLYSIPDGGVANWDEHGHLYLEEAPTKRISCILDGFMYAMFGVYDYFAVTQEPQAKEIFDECVSTLEFILPSFDLRFWSRADCFLQLPKMPASKFYHHVHIAQLEAMYHITKKEIFQTYARRWRLYERNLFCRALALLYKIWFKIFYY